MNPPPLDATAPPVLGAESAGVHMTPQENDEVNQKSVVVEHWIVDSNSRNMIVYRNSDEGQKEVIVSEQRPTRPPCYQVSSCAWRVYAQSRTAGFDPTLVDGRPRAGPSSLLHGRVRPAYQLPEEPIHRTVVSRHRTHRAVINVEDRGVRVTLEGDCSNKRSEVPARFPSHLSRQVGASFLQIQNPWTDRQLGTRVGSLDAFRAEVRCQASR